jgi:hypothetical protein
LGIGELRRSEHLSVCRFKDGREAAGIGKRRFPHSLPQRSPQDMAAVAVGSKADHSLDIGVGVCRNQVL